MPKKMFSLSVCLEIKYQYFKFLGQPITLEYPYSSHVPEPSIYDEISRHAVCGFTSSTSQSSEQEPVDMDWSVSIKGATSGEICQILLMCNLVINYDKFTKNAICGEPLWPGTFAQHNNINFLGCVLILTYILFFRQHQRRVFLPKKEKFIR